MELVPTPTARGHEEPFAVQFSLFMPNRVGQLAELLEQMSDNDVALYGMSVVDSTDWAVVRMVFADANHARELLRKRGQSFTESVVLLVELPTQDTLREICEHLLRAEVNLHFAFPLTIHSHDYPVLAIHVDEPTVATQILTRRGLVLLGAEDLADPGKS